MHRAQASVLVLATCAGLLAAPAAVLAQSAPAQDEVRAARSEVIIVTATRRAESLTDVPLAVTALSGESLNRKQILDFQSLAAQVPGFSVQTRSAGFNQLIIRGQNTGSTGASVATVIDDMPFNFVTSRGSSGLLAANIDTWDLQRIEVLRGPQGTLYGAAAQGGLIKYVTNAPKTGET
ncbi:TonB-dependent receptor plug domain-containing protein, partial [Aphanothece microscopica]|uniref:TonB-dependent receptor plug domain-containing protein n=1 Tax=Aphanothece microscopica TaxID=1049561 RepID=UPI003CE4B943